MVRLYIRNGICNVEEFFKLVSTESKVAILFFAYQNKSFTLKDLGERSGIHLDTSVSAKRLSEFVANNMLNKLVYNHAAESGAIYHVTQKAVDILPAFELMHSFCRQWQDLDSSEVFEWITYTKKLLGSRWNARIVWLLFVLRAVRFNELKNSIEGISFKMLAQQLRHLESEGVVLRTDFHENPPHIEYSLTPKGEALYHILLMISSWYAKYDDKKPSPTDDSECELILSI